MNKDERSKRDQLLAELKEVMVLYGKYVGSQVCSPEVAEYMDEETMMLLTRTMRLCVSLMELAELQSRQLDKIEDSVQIILGAVTKQQKGGDR